ncbi:MAG TPA: hypothetical protein VE091_01380 [Gemmatimonadales bacterium]|jgi:hypothetical protein|nr:hypothetical protein [Gemmatimonadales bacterium]
MRLWSRVSPVLLALSATTTALAAQTPRGLVEVPDESGRRGFWVGAGLGAGAESFDLRDGLGYSSTLTEPTVSFALGGTVGRHWRLGGEALIWFHDIPGGTESLSSFLLIGQWYPSARAGFFLKGGAGLGRNGADFNDGYGVADVGFAALAGAGYEIALSRRFALVPAVEFAQHFYSGDRGFPGYRERLLSFGLGVAFQTGR